MDLKHGGRVCDNLDLIWEVPKKAAGRVVKQERDAGFFVEPFRTKKR